jgi:chemotaxis protein histidine kinase CheA/ActR/RegA family two-component response regulator
MSGVDSDVDLELLGTFIDEARVHQAILEGADASPEARKHAAHGLAGAAAIVGLDPVRDAARALEGGGLAPAEREMQLAVIGRELARLEREVSAQKTPVITSSALETTDAWDPETTALLRSLFRQEADEHLEVITARLLEAVGEPAALNEALRRAHTLKGSAGTVGYVCTQRAAHQLEERLVQLRDGKARLAEGVIDQLLAACDLLRPMTQTDTLEEAETLLVRFGEHLEAVDRVAEEPPGAATGRRRTRTTEVAVELSRAPERRSEDLHVIRVDVERIDELMNAVGQLVIDRTRVERRMEELRGLSRDLVGSRHALFNSVAELAGGPQGERLVEIDAELADVSANLERAARGLGEDSEALRRTTHQLQEQLTRVRMMSIRWLFARLSRPLRELARSEGKQVELATAGESTELDRSVLEKITDPLIHLIRNAVAHGIEIPERRQAEGKSATGSIRVSARHQGEFIFIEVEDDGAGVEPEQLRAALRRWGRLEADPDQLSEEELLDCLFISGFSTRSEADSLAGRGLGLDVVRRNVSSLGGDISVSSRPGYGTRFVIRLPLTTAITQALLFRQDQVVYAVPVAHVVETRSATSTDLRDAAGRSELLHRGSWLPVLWLHELLGESAEESHEQASAMVVLAFGKGEFALGCSHVIGPREIVLKPLGPFLSRIPLFAGATVSGGGEVQLVLDVAALDELVQGVRARRRIVFPAVRRERLPQRRILLADDSRAIREAVSLILRGAGYVVDAAVDGWEAWDWLRRRRYDLLVTDLEMPRLHGYQLIERCRESADHRTLPIVVLSSRTADKNRQLAEEAGADAYLAKPVNRRVILEQVAELLGRPADDVG